MRLLEIIPTPETDRAAIDAVAHFSDVSLGKGVVYAKDTPNFIANRIGTFSVLNVMRLMQEMDLSIEEVDALTGDAVGWPKSATFRTVDLVGLDILGHVARQHGVRNVQEERSSSSLPDFYQKMLERKWLGDKTKGGFYKKVKGATVKSDAWRSTGRRWNIVRGRRRSSLLWTWRKMSRTPGARLRMLLGLEAVRRKATKPERFYGRRSPICGPIRPIAFRKFPTPLSRSIAP